MALHFLPIIVTTKSGMVCCFDIIIMEVACHKVIFDILIESPNKILILIVGERAGIKTNVIVPMATSRLTEDIFPPGRIEIN